MQTPLQVLSDKFGYEHFRPMQEEIITQAMAGDDVVVIMPTGGGKSICYQIPAICQEGTCIVVSPLISLMKDQVDTLLANGIEAAFLNSSLSPKQQQEIESQFLKGFYQLLYVSPEKITSSAFLPILKAAPINLIAIDEAHCISSWGHDFRPEYTQLAFLKSIFPSLPFMALTATADKLTRKDIVQQLHLQEPTLFLASFDRPNISLEVQPGQGRFQTLLSFIREREDQPGILYCLSRKNTEKLAEKLLNAGIIAGAYHAGLSTRDRTQIQEAFLNDRLTVVCATIAFGMGIDKSNVRWVIHYNLPKNMEGFYQEIGRSGRDGAPANTLLFYSYQDVMLWNDIFRKEEGNRQDLKIEKLNRIKEYAETFLCRRKVLLAYFGETLSEPCGNCDNCRNPPQTIDGTIITQKALSAVYRLKEKVGMNMLIDVLRGSQRQEITALGYHRIKTYGAGRELSPAAWRFYLTQMLQTGMLEMAYDRANALTLGPNSKAVLFEKASVQLIEFIYQKSAPKKKKTVSAKEGTRQILLKALKKCRRDLAVQRGVPPYIVFTDASLIEMTEKIPLSDQQFKRISGVSQRKWEIYGPQFQTLIREFAIEQVLNGKKITGGTNWVTFDLLNKGHSPEEIAEHRGLGLKTIYSHLAYLYHAGENIPVEKWVSKQELDGVEEALRIVGDATKLKPIFEFMDGKLNYDRIHFALAILNSEVV